MVSEGNFPNTFQTPNVFVDTYFNLLTKDECLCLMVASREILGWEKGRLEKRACISLSRFQELVPATRQAIITALKGLCQFRLMTPIGEATSAGQEYELTAVLDADAVDVLGLETRRESRKQKGRKRTIKARSVRQTSGQSDRPAVSQTDQRSAGLTSDGQSDRPEGGQSDRPNKPRSLNQDLNPEKDSSAPDGAGRPAEAPEEVNPELKSKPKRKLARKASTVKTRPPKPEGWGDLVAAVIEQFKERPGPAAKIAEQLAGCAPDDEARGGENNCSPPATAADIPAFVAWYRKDHPDADLPTRADRLPSWWHKFVLERKVGRNGTDREAAYARNKAIFDRHREFTPSDVPDDGGEIVVAPLRRGRLS